MCHPTEFMSLQRWRVTVKLEFGHLSVINKLQWEQ